MLRNAAGFVRKRTGEEACSCLIIQTYTSIDIRLFFVFLNHSSCLFLLARLNQTYRQLLTDNELLTTDHKQLKSQLNEVKLEHTWLEADFNKLKTEFQQLDINCTKLSNQCEVCALPGGKQVKDSDFVAQNSSL